MSNVIIIILREVLEAALLISVLLACANTLKISIRWLPISLCIGTLGAIFLAWQLKHVSNAFEGIGQEILNILLLFLITISLLIAAYFVAQAYYRTDKNMPVKYIMYLFAIIVSHAMFREGTEIFIYTSSYFYGEADVWTLLLGSWIGAGIGLSLGILTYYALVSVTNKRLLIIISLMALIAAGMAMQIIQYLMQAGLITQNTPLWNSNHLINENSIIGQLLYAFIGYEASPTAIQATTYIVILLIVAVIVISIKNIKRD